MDENSVRDLLRTVAAAAEPPSMVDLDGARRRGRRDLWIRWAAAPALAMVAVAGVVTVPRVLSSDHPERTVASASHYPVSHPAVSARAPVSAPAVFNPLVPYAGFGWLPPGFSEGAAASIDIGNGFSAGTGSTSLEAADPVAGHCCT